MLGKKSSPVLLTLLVMLVLICSCAAKTETIISKDNEYKGGAIDSVLIIGVTKNAENRILFEKTFSEIFEKESVKAYASINVFQPDQQLTRESIKQKALDLGVKAVILTHMISVTEEDVYQPGSSVTTRNIQTTPMGNYFVEVNVIDYPGYYKKYKFVRLKTNLYETATENLIFSSSSKTIDPKSVEDTIQSVCKAFIKDIKKNGLL